MTRTKDGSPQLDVEASSFESRARDEWVEAEPALPSRSHQAGATVHTPREDHNEFGPGSELKPDPATVPSLMTLAATLGIPILAGERLLEGDPGDDRATEDGYDAPLYTDPSVLLDQD